MNKQEQAGQVLKKAIALNPNLGHNKGQVSTAHHRLAQSLLKLGQTEAGQTELQIASDLKAQVFKLEQKVHTGTAGMGTTRLPGAESNSPAFGFRQALNSTESNGRNKKPTQELQNSADYYEKVVAAAHNNVGLIRAQLQDFREAAEHFAIALRWNP